MVTYGPAGEFKTIKTRTPKAVGGQTAYEETEKYEWVSSPGSADQVTARIVYLPDLTEKYRADIVPGNGSSDISIELRDGWQLSKLNAEADNQLDEAVGSFAELIKAAPSVLAPFALPQGTGTRGTSQPIRLFKMKLDQQRAIVFEEIPIPGL